MTVKVIHVVAAAAPPVLELPDLIDVLRAEGWTTCVILTPTAATWVDRDELSGATGFPVRVEQRLPSERDPLPDASAVLAVPLTFNSINKWGGGISDTLALGLLNEALGLDVPVIAVPTVKRALRRHPAYAPNVAELRDAGVVFLDPDAVTVRREEGPCRPRGTSSCARWRPRIGEPGPASAQGSRIRRSAEPHRCTVTRAR